MVRIALHKSCRALEEGSTQTERMMCFGQINQCPIQGQRPWERREPGAVATRATESKAPKAPKAPKEVDG